MNFESKVKRINGTFILSLHGKIFDSTSYVEFELLFDMLTVMNEHYHCVNLLLVCLVTNLQAHFRL
jgi:hypothetical protein